MRPPVCGSSQNQKSLSVSLCAGFANRPSAARMSVSPRGTFPSPGMSISDVLDWPSATPRLMLSAALLNVGCSRTAERAQHSIGVQSENVRRDHDFTNSSCGNVARQEFLRASAAPSSWRKTTFFSSRTLPGQSARQRASRAALDISGALDWKGRRRPANCSGEVIDQGRNVVTPFAQGRHRETDGVEPIVQIVQEQSRRPRAQAGSWSSRQST